MSSDRPAVDELRSLCRGFLDARCPIEQLSERLELGPDLALWSELVSMGWPGTLVAECDGGLGWSWREAVVLAEELGRFVVNVPFLSTALVAVEALRSVPPSPAAQDALAAIATGAQTVAAAGHIPANMSWRPWRVGAAVQLAEAGSSAVRLHGSVPLVADGAIADLLLLVVDLPEGPDLALVELDQEAVTVRANPTVDASRQLATVLLDGAVARRLTERGAAAEPAAAMLGATALGVAADAVGGAAAVHEQSVAYALERVQFGRPIGAFQAIKHRLADLYLLVQASGAAVEAAAAAQSPEAGGEVDDGGDPASIGRACASLAYAYATDAYAKVAGDAILVHGAIGFTWEHALHRYLKRANLDQHLAGPAAWHREQYLMATMQRLHLPSGRPT